MTSSCEKFSGLFMYFGSVFGALSDEHIKRGGQNFCSEILTEFCTAKATFLKILSKKFCETQNFSLVLGVFEGALQHIKN